LPEAVHDVAFVEDQVSVNDEPTATEEALVVNVTVGWGVGVGVEVEPLSPLPQLSSSTAIASPTSK